MSPNEKILLEKYLKIVNEKRELNDGYELSPDKSFHEHLKLEYPNYEIPESSQPTVRNNEKRVYHPADSSLSDSSISSDSSSSVEVDDKKSSPTVININESDSDMSIEGTTTTARACTTTGLPVSNNTSSLDLDGSNNDLLPKETQFYDFINSLMDLVSCPISMDIFKDPAITPIGKVFERKQLMKWLDENNNTCPLTRQYIAQQEVNECHTMKRLIELMKNQDITSDFLSEMRSERSRVSPSLVQDMKPSSTQELQPGIQLISKKLRKARRKTENRRIKKKLNKKIN